MTARALRLRRVLAASPHRAVGALLGVALLAAVGLQVVDVNPASSQTVQIEALRVADASELGPDAGVWDRVPGVEIPLSAQGSTYPLGGGSVPTVRARAVHDGEMLGMQLTWSDDSSDIRSDTPEAFSDAAAVQFPVSAESSVPSVCMGQADAGVNIWQWRADSEHGLPESAEDLSSRAVADVPADEERDYPARAAGNPMAIPGARTVQNLRAEGFGTIGPVAEQTVQGTAVHDRDAWSVVFRRELDAPGEDQPTFAVGTATDVAFAVWDGEAGDRDGQKSVSSFATLELVDDDVPGAAIRWPVFLVVGLALVAAVWFIGRGGLRVRSS